MDEFFERAKTPESDTEAFANAYYRNMRETVRKLFPGKIINTATMSFSNRFIVKMSFTDGYGQPLPPEDWRSIVEHAAVVFSDTMLSLKDARETRQDIRLSSLAGDPDYNYDQVLIIENLTM